MKVIIFAFLFSIFISIFAQQNDYCKTCYKIINDLKEEFNQGFDGVTVNQLINALDQECKDALGGSNEMICISTAKKNAAKLLKVLRKKGSNNNQACVALGFCKNIF
uniref:Saposin B-type domain-containing protein n=1 Tax=Panagrolaimus sp. PS1159 TaxID=55785 RepID=A0AC35EWD3_9BILA